MMHARIQRPDDERSSDHAVKSGSLALPPIVLGGGVFGAQYNSQDYLQSELPAEIIKLAFDYGINAIDTSPFYGASESIIGKAINSSAIASKYPRESYFLITKCGRYGANKDMFDYSPTRIRKSVDASLAQFQTTYLDIVYLHDCEFIADSVGNLNGPGNSLVSYRAYNEGKPKVAVAGKGDALIIQAFQTLLELKQAGKIRNAGLAGYPLPTLLRLARLIRDKIGAVDVVQTYSHFNLQNTSLSEFIQLFREAGVTHVTNASPLNMGLLTSAGPPYWHLAPQPLRDACLEINEQLEHRSTDAAATTIQAVALGFALKSSLPVSRGGLDTPVVVGCSHPSHLHDCIRIWQTLYGPGGSSEQGDARKTQKVHEDIALTALQATGYQNWSWESPPPFTEAERNA